MLGLGNAVHLKSALGSTESLPAFSLSLDGTTDYINFTNTTFAVDGSGDNLSIAFWAQRTDNNDEAVILGLNTTGSFSRLNFDSDGDALFIESDANGEWASAPVTADTAWHHYVITSTGGGGAAEVIIYEDGSSISTTQNNFGNSGGKNFTINRIGDDNASGNQAFKGLLYQLAIWDVALDADAIAAIYNSGVPIPLREDKGNYDNSRDLLHLWRFGAGETDSETDDSIGGLTGTLINNAAFSTDTPTS
jgi:hypothetical protein